MTSKANQIEGEQGPMTRMERMLEAMNLDAAREIIGEFQDELNSLEVSHNLNPNVGDVTPLHSVGFSVIKPKEWEKYIKNARKDGLSEDAANEIVAMIAQGKALHDHFDKMLQADLAGEIETELDAKGKADKLIDEQAPVLIRETKKELVVEFTQKEKNAFQSDLILNLQRKSQLEDQKSGNASMYSAKIKECSSKIDLLITQLSTGYENKSVECEWRLNFPIAGKKTLFRLDLNEIVEEEDMLPADRQLVLDDVREKAGKTERSLDEKEITEVDPDQQHEEDGESDEMRMISTKKKRAKNDR
jgi:hypothetical protein